MILSFVVYSKDLDLWAYNIIFMEKNLQGLIYAHHPISMVFEPHKFETSAETAFFVFDIFKVTLIFIFCIYEIAKEFWGWRKYKNKTLINCIIVTIWMLVIMALTITYWVFHFHTNGSSYDLLEKANKMYQDKNLNHYEDLWTTARYYELAIRFEAMILLFNMVLLVRVLRIIPIINFFFNVIKSSIIMFLPLSTVFVVLFIGYAIVGSQLWCTYFYGLKDFQNSFVYILLLFELSTGTSKVNLYENFNFGYEKFFGMLLIVMIIISVLAFSLTVSVVITAFKRNKIFYDNQRNTKAEHYLSVWIKASRLNKLFFCSWRRKNREEAYRQRDSQDEANVEMIRNIGRRP
jgi:flagellar basal body-associated protein FliL